MIVDPAVGRLGGLPSLASRDWWRSALAALKPLWVGGVAVLCLLFAFLATPALSQISPRASVWALYLVLGTLFPAVVAIKIAMERAGRTLPTPIAVVLIVLPIAAAAIMAGPVQFMIAVGLAQVQTVVCTLIISRRGRITSARTLSLFVFSVVAWVVCLEVFTWDPMPTLLPPSWSLLLVGLVALIACSWWAFDPRSAAVGLQLYVRRIVDMASIVFLILLAFRTDGLFTTDGLGEDGTFYHWGVFVAPAEAVRQGGWLLWDVPAPYGFLATLTAAAFPAVTTWQSLYLLNAIASALLVMGLYWVIRAVQPGLAGAVVALPTAAAIVFLVSRYPPSLSPAHYFPMSGPFRYVWCYVLIGVLLLERRARPGSGTQHLILLAGCLSWLLSLLWSAESAFYGSVIWIPAFTLIVLRDYTGIQGKLDWKMLVAWLLVPPLLLAVAVAAIVLTYREFLGEGPDGLAYLEAVISFSGTRASDVMGTFEATDFPSTIAVIVFGFLMLALSTAAIARTNVGLKDLPTALGLALGLWGLLSYSIGTPVIFAIFRFMPFMVLALVIVLAFIAPRYRGEDNFHWIDFVKIGSVTLLVALLTITYANFSALQQHANAILAEGFRGRDVTAGLPHVDPSLADLLQDAGVLASDPIFYAGAVYGDPMPVWTPAGQTDPVVVSRQWLSGPMSAMVFLSDDRKQSYMRRSSERRPEGGWLIERQNREGLVYAIDSWFFEQLNASYIPTKIATNTEWRLVWYEPAPDLEAVASAERATAPSPDLRINGKRQAGSVSPRVWGYFGSEWTSPTTDQPWRCVMGGGSLKIYSPEPLQTQLVLGFPGNEFDGKLEVAVNDESPVVTDRKRRGKDTAPVSLRSGWNTIAIKLTSPDRAALDVANTADGCEAAGSGGWPLQIDDVEIHFQD